MDDRSIPAARWSVVRRCESSRHQRQLLAQAYQQVAPQARRSLGQVPAVNGPCRSPMLQRVTAARVGAGA
jgi:hypothetical protein